MIVGVNRGCTPDLPGCIRVGGQSGYSRGCCREYWTFHSLATYLLPRYWILDSGCSISWCHQTLANSFSSFSPAM